MDEPLSIRCPRCDKLFYHDGSLAGMVIACSECGGEIQMPGEVPPTRRLDDAALKLRCEIFGQHPVQAEGRIDGWPFYFRAKWDQWSFTVCVNSDDDDSPSMINPPTDDEGYSDLGFFRDGEREGFFLAADYGSEQDASFMDLDIAERIIRRCCAQYLSAAPPS